jgi:HEAT repeat protein
MRTTRKRQDPWDSTLQALNALPPTAERTVQNEAIAQALASPHFRVVAKAATLAGERSLHERIPDLLAAYPRFLQDGTKQDPQCLAKAALTGALLALECGDVSFWLAGIRCRQPEPVWGSTTDTAVDVRCNCALGLGNSGHARAIIELTVLLNDPERRVRAGAARAISCGDPLQAEPLLRFKILAGDADAEVLGECFTALLALAPVNSMSLVASRLLDADEAVRDYAALALGESRHPLALDHLKAAWNGTLVPSGLRTVLARAAALHRSEAAFDWLVGIIEEGRAEDAAIAADALSVYDRNTKLMQWVKVAQAARKGR